MGKICGRDGCNRGCYGEYCLMHKPRKPIPKQSDKEKEYQIWKEEVARPAIIARDGNYCFCCKRWAYDGEKLDIEHQLTKGSRPDLKRDMHNLRLYCRSCHRRKTDNKKCLH